MQRCLTLAKNGLGTTYPNPLVGSVIVHNDKIIGEGWHYQSGKPHAEVNAINSVKDTSLLPEATIYVSLEPCSHFGKTPPCSHLIVKKGIKNVVIGMIDNNDLVCGKGVAYLQENGCKVTIGVLEEECKELNKRFFTFHHYKRPYVILKWAETQDGFMDVERSKDTPTKPHWISNVYSQQQTHKMRSTEQAIIVGANTVINDRPKLTSRSWYGNHPIAVVIDKDLAISEYHSLINSDRKLVVITDISNKGCMKNITTISYHYINFKEIISSQIVNILYSQGIQSVIVEGGKQTLQTFIGENTWDEAHRFVGNIFFERGLKAPQISTKIGEVKQIKEDTYYLYHNHYK